MDVIEQVELPDGVTVAELRRVLRRAGAAFAFVHGSRVAGTHRPGSDVDVAVWFGRPVAAWEIDLPGAAELMVLDTAGLELAGRVAQHGVLLFDDDPQARIAWQADRSKRFLDEARRRDDLVATVFGRG